MEKTTVRVLRNNSLR